MPSSVLAWLQSDHWLIPNNHWLSLRRFGSYIFLQTKRKLGFDRSFQSSAPSKVPLDIFIPTVEKDAEMLELCITSAKKYVKHPIGTIYIVAPDNSAKIKAIAAKHGCSFVDESTIIDLKKTDINYTVGRENRSGWIYKMLLNLASDTVCSNRYILILDSDTVFIAPQIFIYKDRPLFNLSDEYHLPYFDIDRRLLGLQHRLSRSFVTHYMLFDAKVLGDLRASLEAKWGAPWYSAIVKNIDTKELSGFADYEIYGDFYGAHGPNRPILNYWSNISLSINKLSEFDELVKAYSGDYRSISLHNYER